MESPRDLNLSKIYQIESKFEKGYDSDGKPEAWCDVEAIERVQHFDEDAPVEKFHNLQFVEVRHATDTTAKIIQEINIQLPSTLPPEIHIPIVTEKLEKL